MFWVPYLLVLRFFKTLTKASIWIHFEGFIGIRYPFKFAALTLRWSDDLIKYLTKEDDRMAKLFGIQPNQVQDFILKDQEKDSPEDQIIWKVKFLDARASAEITDQVYSAKGFGKKREELLKAGTQTLEILRSGLVGWDNFKYENGDDVEWEDPPRSGSKTKLNEVMDRNINKIPPNVREELAEEIRGASMMDSD